MNIKDILAKLNKGETLSDEEKGFLSKFDYDAELNAAAASARRKAEGERDAAKTELDKLKAEAASKAKADEEAAKAKMTDEQKQAEKFKALEAKVAQLQKDREAEAAKAKALQRSQDIAGIREKAGIQFAAGIDPAITGAAFAQAFDGLDDLSDEAEVSARVKKFKESNSGLISAAGHGSGLGGSPKVDLGGENPYSKATFNLTRQIELETKEPERAAALMAAAKKE